MKTINLLIACFGLAFDLLSSGALGAEAIPSWQVSSSIIGYSLGGAGFAFTPGVEIVVTSIGYQGELLTHEAVELALWDSTGQKLATQVVVINSPSFNGTHYTPIPALVLKAGETYCLSSCGSSGVWSGDSISSAYHNGTFSVAPELNYIGMALTTSSGGIFPGSVFPGANLAVGPNFQFEKAPLIVVDGLRPSQAQVRLDFGAVGGFPASFTLLESAQPGGPWLTNAQAVLHTNLPGASYAFTAPAPGGSRFYRVQCP